MVRDIYFSKPSVWWYSWCCPGPSGLEGMVWSHWAIFACVENYMLYYCNHSEHSCTFLLPLLSNLSGNVSVEIFPWNYYGDYRENKVSLLLLKNEWTEERKALGLKLISYNFSPKRKVHFFLFCLLYCEFIMTCWFL